MVPFTHLLMLIVAFLGANLSGTRMDIEPRHGDPDRVAPFCTGYDGSDFHHNYAKEQEWYRWEQCLLKDAEGNSLKNDDYLLSKEEAQALVEEVWENYMPWIQQEVRRKAFWPKAPDNLDGEWLQLVVPENWAPKVPMIHTGRKQILEHCGSDVRGCSSEGGLFYDLSTAWRLGRSVWWTSDSSYDEYRTEIVRLSQPNPQRIVTHNRNRFVLLHELAHTINFWQFTFDLWHFWLEQDERSPVEHEEHYRTHGHEHDFKCLALDLYNDYGGDIADVVPGWDESYSQLNRLCQIIAPGYAQPNLD